MGKLIERCAGIDIGKRFLVCCVMTGACRLGHYRSTPFSGRAATDFWLLPSLLLTSDPSGRILWSYADP
jgi:hypothetical protein